MPRLVRTVLLEAGSGLRMSELFALKWKDIDFVRTEMSVTRSIVNQVVGRCKTEASQKPVPLDAHLAQAVQDWFQQAKYARSGDWFLPALGAKAKHRTADKPGCATTYARQHGSAESLRNSGGTRRHTPTRPS
jgi:integrase